MNEWRVLYCCWLPALLFNYTVEKEEEEAGVIAEFYLYGVKLAFCIFLAWKLQHETQNLYFYNQKIK